MAIYQIDTISIKTSIFTLIMSLFATLYFTLSFIYLYYLEQIGVDLNTTVSLSNSYYISLISFVISSLLFTYNFIMIYFFNKILEEKVFTNNIYKILGVFVLSLFLTVVVFINADIFDSAYKNKTIDNKTFFNDSMQNMFYFSVIAGLFIMFYMFYYVYQNILKTNTHFNQLKLKVMNDKIDSDGEIIEENNKNENNIFDKKKDFFSKRKNFFKKSLKDSDSDIE